MNCPRHNYPVGITNNCKLCMEEYDKWYNESGNHDRDMIDEEIILDQQCLI
jgi:hypothetical protein